MTWTINVHKDVRDWLHAMRRSDHDTLMSISAAIDVLQLRGPGLGRPLVDTVRGSELPHLKELRPGFDPARRAVLLVGGDKSADWRGWYARAIPLAEDRYWEHVKAMETAPKEGGPDER
ncbi:type II toxin-antitoxin system RelE/ParE family toxin [Nonomuraea guangzhouensis]|uniref:Type II toxin-antitoxin system RelE/ParE family toxin n=1 Tax=Nonomuraea guangzhouensis TaxID=1291555 RepID=A0ABW4G4K7_9ACTN|nr:type II toxin-antitoxin system RelE/ParE family toxin [Nonomuraea guangzhouensis]